jgi:hypothetical protein
LQIQARRLFAIDVFAGPGAGDGLFMVQKVRRGHDNGINAVQKLGVIRNCLSVKLCREFLRDIQRHIGNRHIGNRHKLSPIRLCEVVHDRLRWGRRRSYQCVS